MPLWHMVVVRARGIQSIICGRVSLQHGCRAWWYARQQLHARFRCHSMNLASHAACSGSTQHTGLQ
eukprot:scaffold169598_cov18-Tisochrysis_lutea.AAC.1